MAGSGKYRTGFEMNIERSGNENARDDSPTPNSHQTSDDPFYISILGDFSGRDNQNNYDVSTIAKRRFIEVDRDNLDDVLASMDINLQLWLDDEDFIEVPVKSMDDFHPDQLFQNVEVFSQLRSILRRIKNNSTFAEAANELASWLNIESTSDSSDNNSSEPMTASTDNLLDSMLDASSSSQTSSGRDSGATMADKLVKQIIAPYVEPKADPRQDEMVVSLEQAIAAHMQFILHHPDFQALEAAWLSLDFLTRRIETGSRLKIFITDIARYELEVDMSEDNVTETALYKKYCDPAPGDVAWGLILGNYRFSDRVEEIMSLLQIGAIARKARAPFITSANETLIGCESFAVTPDVDDWNYQLEPEIEMAWSLLRNADEAEYISMVVPRFLLRIPYGKKSKPVESFAFEEMPEVHCHSCYLWGNGAFIKAEQLARAYSQQGWDMEPASARQIDDLPLHYYKEDGEMQVKPVAEIQLTEKGGQLILQKGLIPLWSVKNSDSIRSSDFHSISA